jgi:DDE superfamily endonuclease
MRPRAPCADLSRRDTVACRTADVKGIPWPSTSSHLRCSSQILVMIGRVTMLVLPIWAGTGGSHRTVQRFCSTVIPWAMLCWVFCRQHVYGPEDVSLLAGDEVVVTNAGKPTCGLDHFFSSMHGKPCAGAGLLHLVARECQATACVSAAEKATSKAKAVAKQPTSPPATCRPIQQ